MESGQAPLWLPILAALLLLLGACAANREPLGGAYKEAFANQVINPAAPSEPGPVAELPGTAATQVYNDIYLPSLGSSSQ